MDINVLQKQNKAWNLLIYLKNKEHFGFSVKQELIYPAHICYSSAKVL